MIYRPIGPGRGSRSATTRADRVRGSPPDQIRKVFGFGVRSSRRPGWAALMALGRRPFRFCVRRTSFHRTPAASAGPDVVNRLLSLGALPSIAEGVQLAEGLHIPRATGLALWTRRHRPHRIAGTDQVWNVEGPRKTDGPAVIRRFPTSVQMARLAASWR